MTPEAQRLVEANIRLAQKLAWEYAQKWHLLPKLRIDMDDLLSIMYLELCNAAQSYDPARGYTFATYFYQCALNAARMLIRNSHTHRRRASITAVSLDMPGDAAGRTPADKSLYVRYWQGMQQWRIGEVTGMAQANVSRLLRGSRQRIKDMITTLEAGT